MSSTKTSFLRHIFPWILVGATLACAQTKVKDTLFLTEDATPIFRNPGKGWVLYEANPSWLTAEQQSRLSVCYVRYNWSDFNPSENTYNWKKLDADIASCKAAGMKYAFGIANMNMDWGPDNGYATPKWVFDAGATYYRVKDNRRTTLYNVIPYWSNNPVFFAKYKVFLAALGAKYDGNPDVAWVDIRGYGNWGEGHQGGIDKDEFGKSVPYPSSTEMTKYYHQPQIDAFPKTQLTLCYGLSSHDSAYKVAVERGVGMRIDGVPDWSDGTTISFVDGKQPNIIEYTSSYQDLISQKIWTDAKVIQVAMNAHATYAEVSRGNPQQFMTAADAYMKSLTNKLGYHFVLRSVAMPWDNIGAKTAFSFQMKWSNLGTTNLYNLNCFVALALLDKNGLVVDTSWLDGIDPKTWRPGNIDFVSSAKFAKAPAGTYSLAVGLFTSKSKTAPDYKIGNTGRDTKGWNHLSDAFVVKTSAGIQHSKVTSKKPNSSGTWCDMRGSRIDKSWHKISAKFEVTP